LGICANIDFPLPAGFIWNIFYRVLPGIPESQPFAPAVMKWRLMKALDELRDTETFQAVRHYIGGRDPFKQYELCVRLAQCFDQYLVYRLEWITKWGQCKRLSGRHSLSVISPGVTGGLTNGHRDDRP
jgi:exodeoxyribonuclease V gamma subunit